MQIVIPQKTRDVIHVTPTPILIGEVESIKGFGDSII